MVDVNVRPAIHRFQNLLHHVGQCKLIRIAHRVANVPHYGLNVNLRVLLKQLAHEVTQVDQSLGVVAFGVEILLQFGQFRQAGEGQNVET